MVKLVRGGPRRCGWRGDTLEHKVKVTLTLVKGDPVGLFLVAILGTGLVVQFLPIQR